MFQAAHLSIIVTALLLVVLSANAERRTLRGCTDLRGENRCYRWYLRGHCHHGRFVSVMSRVCRNTCGTCWLPEGEAIQTTTPTPSTAPASQASVVNGYASCRDSVTYCASFKTNGYCAQSHRFNPYMKNNCKKTCGFCGTTVTTCRDTLQYCNRYTQYCKPGTQHHDWMKKNCPATCSMCPGAKTTPKPVVTRGPVVTRPTRRPVVTQPPVTSRPTGKKQIPCSFDSSLCQWVNEPIDDTANWKTGIYPRGPQKAAEGSGYLYLDSPYASGKALLYFPWYLNLSPTARDLSNLCLRFKYSNDQGTLKVSTRALPTETNKNPSDQQLFISSSSTNGWKNVAVNLRTIPVKSSLVIEGVQGRTGGHVVLDDMAFYRGQC